MCSRERPTRRTTGFVAHRSRLPPSPDVEIESVIAGAIDIEADRMDTDTVDSEETVFKGNVNVARDNQRLWRRMSLRFKPSGDRVLAIGNVKLWQDGVFVGADRAELAAGEESCGPVRRSSTDLSTLTHMASADSVALSGRDILRARDATYSDLRSGPRRLGVARLANKTRSRSQSRGGPKRHHRFRRRTHLLQSMAQLSTEQKTRSRGFLMPSAGVSDCNRRSKQPFRTISISRRTSMRRWRCAA